MTEPKKAERCHHCGKDSLTGSPCDDCHKDGHSFDKQRMICIRCQEKFAASKGLVFAGTHLKKIRLANS